MGRVREKRRVEKRRAAERRSEKRKSQKKEDAGARKGRKVAKQCVFSMICGSGGSKSRLVKAAGAEPSGQMRDEKLHAVVVRSTFPSQNVQNTTCSDHFWKLRCRKSARRCGAKYICKRKSLKHLTFGPLLRCRKSAYRCGTKHISKSKCTKHTRSGPLLEVEMSKKCTPLWREAHLEVKMCKNTICSDYFLTFRCRFAWQAQGIVHLVKSEQNVRVL